MSAMAFNIGGRVYARFAIQQGNIFVWTLRGSGGATPTSLQVWHLPGGFGRHSLSGKGYSA